MDDEIKGEGNSMNYTFRMHDSRVGRFLSIDPLTQDYPWNSPYSFSENRVIDKTELEGLEVYDPDARPSGVTLISNAIIPPGIIGEKGINVSPYTLMPVHSTSNNGGDYWIARLNQDDGSFVDHFVVGPDGVKDFIQNTRDYRRNANIFDWGIALGGLDHENLYEAWKSNWTVENVMWGISIGGKVFLPIKTPVNKSAPKISVVEKIVVTENTISEALEGSAMKTIQSEVSIPVVQRYVDRIIAGEQAPPIKVNNGIIIDGNHHFVAGEITGVVPKVVPGGL